MILRLTTSFAALIAVSTNGADAMTRTASFQSQSTTKISNSRIPYLFQLRKRDDIAIHQKEPSFVQHEILTRSSPRPLRMSSIPDDEDTIKQALPWHTSLKQALPPLPEDLMALSGDVLALFVYSYLDHTINELYTEAATMDVADLVASIADPESSLSLPVWFDPSHLQEFSHWLVQTPSSTPPYAPAIAASGLAFVSISTCWIVCGYFSGAFLHKNTLECDTSQAMMITGKTWMVTALLMVGLALGSDALWGQLDGMNPLSDAARGGLTKADADYIFDSLTVLAFWRFMLNSILGYR